MAKIETRVGIKAGGLIEAMNRFSDALNGFSMLGRYAYFEQSLTDAERKWFM